MTPTYLMSKNLPDTAFGGAHELPLQGVSLARDYLG